MTAVSPAPGVGGLLRDWRQRRRMSQLDLAVDAEVSARHISFVETGRAKPSRELVLHLAEHLDVPLRDRNALLLAAGYAPVYQETPLDAQEMAPVRDALDTLLKGHEPFPAIVVDGRWDLVSANEPALAILSDGVDPRLLTPPLNTMRIAVHPDGLAPRIVNYAAYGGHLLMRVERQAAVSGDRHLVALAAEMRGYLGVSGSIGGASVPDIAALLFVPLVLRVGAAQLTFFSTLTAFGTALDITVSELAIEQFFPADEATAAHLRDAS
jgi:transcriptional regulator with XRE-family HTH domain